MNAARVAHAAGIRINTYALGTQALTRPIAATEIARVTLGTFTPVLEPGAIVATLQAVSFANIEDVGVLNLTTREYAPDVRLNPDGSFVAFVPVREGRNRVLVNALASDGGEANLELEFEFRVKESEGRMKERELATAAQAQRRAAAPRGGRADPPREAPSAHGAGDRHPGRPARTRTDAPTPAAPALGAAAAPLDSPLGARMLLGRDQG